MKHCPSGQYYDKAVSRCQGCNEICFWEYLKDPNSDCNKFCPEVFQAGHAGQDGPASTPVNVPMLVSICCVMVVMVIILVFLWRRFRRPDQTSTNAVKATTLVAQATTLVAQPSDNTPVQQDDMGFAELCIGSGTSDHLLTGEDYSGN